MPSSDEVPDSLLEYDQWVCWRSTERDGKQTKIPVDPATGEFASTTDPETWSSFETARDQVRSGDEAGVGFVFTDADPIVGIDLDDCRVPETESIVPWAADVVERLDSYTEISPSGTGLHVLLDGELPDGRNRHGDIEVYETARFFTVTGEHVDGTPDEIRERSAALQAVYDDHLTPQASTSTDTTAPSVSRGASNTSPGDAELLEKATNAANGEKFERLYHGDTSGYESHSEADMALCSLLAFWTGGDPQQMDRLFRDSGLMRPKWDERHFADGSTYGEKTIERAIAGTSEFYDPDSRSEPDYDASTAAVDNSDSARQRKDHKAARIEELEAQLRSVLMENKQLREELDAVREERDELQAALEDERESGLFNW